MLDRSYTAPLLPKEQRDENALHSAAHVEEQRCLNKHNATIGTDLSQALYGAVRIKEQGDERGAALGDGLQALCQALQARDILRAQAPPRAAEPGRRLGEPQLGQQDRQRGRRRGRCRERLAEQACHARVLGFRIP